MTKLKTSNCEKSQKLKFLQKLKTQIATKFKFFLTKRKNSKSDKTQNSNCHKIQRTTTQKLKQQQHLKTQIVIKLEISNCDTTQMQIVTKLKDSNSDTSISDKT